MIRQQQTNKIVNAEYVLPGTGGGVTGAVKQQYSIIDNYMHIGKQNKNI